MKWGADFPFGNQNLRPDIDFTCQDCTNDGWGPMLTTAVWNKVVPVGNHCRFFLCQSCMELRLGRRLRQGDLRDCPMNMCHPCYTPNGVM